LIHTTHHPLSEGTTITPGAFVLNGSAHCPLDGIGFEFESNFCVAKNDCFHFID